MVLLTCAMDITFELLIDLKMRFCLLRMTKMICSQGLSTVFEKFLSKFVEEDLAPWEAYCKEACLKAPTGLVLPEKVLEMVK
jgi:hypothetical protein